MAGPPMPSSNRLIASFIVAGLILWGAGMIALVFYVQAETSRSNTRKELVDKCLGNGGHLVYDRIQKMACSFEVPTNTLDAIITEATSSLGSMPSTIGHCRSLSEAKAAAQRDHDKNRDQGR